MPTDRGLDHVEAVLFDTFGTVVDWRRGVADAVAQFAVRRGMALDAQAFALRWRSLYQPSMEPVRSGAREFVSLDVLHAENLRVVLAENGIDPDTVDIPEFNWLNTAWHRLPPWPDSVAGLTALRDRAMIAPLSNGNLALLARMAKHSGLPWDVIIGSDVIRAYKPQPEAYQRAVALLGLDPDQVMLVAAHNDDLAAAAAVGLRTGFVARPTEYGPDQNRDRCATGDWDIISDDIVDFAAQFDGGRWTAD